MNPNQTTSSGEELTLITGLGGQPQTRQSIEKLCRMRSSNHQTREAKRSA